MHAQNHLEKSLAYARMNWNRFLDEFQSLLLIPSVSADPAYCKDVRRTSEWILAEMERIGLHNWRLLESAGHPAVYGEWLKAGLDCVIEMGIADPERLGCCGVSGGGNLSCWIVGHTDRFKAVVPENPLTNFHSLYGTSDIGRFFPEKELGGRPWEVPEIYTRCSPVTYAHRCRLR